MVQGRTLQATDFESYREIMGELISPIRGEGLDLDTLKRLYESKAVYLENLRIKCFWELNRKGEGSYFSVEDYALILRAIAETKKHLKAIIIGALDRQLTQRSQIKGPRHAY